MNIRNRVSITSRALASAVIASVYAGSLLGQPTDESEPTGETVVLSPFQVTGKQPGRYQSTEATSGGRVAVSVFEAPQSISVITRDIMNDISSTRVLDAAKYASGVTESILPGGLDRTTVRGFQIDGTTVDGFAAGNQQGNLDPILIERVEVTKGPNAVLSPTAQPGGVINLVSRKPMFSDFGSISYQIGIYNGNRAEFDFNRVIGDSRNWAFRVVAAYQDTTLYPHVPYKNTTVMPMLTWKSKTGAQFTAQFEYFDFWDQNYLGLPIDPAIGSDGAYARILPSLPRDLNLSDNDFRADRRKEVRLLLTAPLSDSLAMRLAARAVQTDVSFSQNIPGPGFGAASGGAVNPLTGNFTPGFNYTNGSNYTGAVGVPVPAVTPIAIAYNPSTLTRTGNDQHTYGPVANLQNDYTHDLKTSFVSARTIGGVALNYSKIDTRVVNDTRTPIDLTNPMHANYVQRNTLTDAGALNTRTGTINISEQAYVSETLKFWEERIVLNGSYAYNNFDISIRNLVPTATGQTRYVSDIDTELKSYSILVKPIPSVALYYSRSEVAGVNTPGTAAIASSTQAAPVALTLQHGIQKEFGIRYEGFDKRLYATICHFDITQDGFSIPNPANLVSPQPNPLLPNLITNRLAKGYELEIRANLTRNFSFIGNATTFTNRDANGAPFRGTAEKSAAALINYRFDSGSALSGLSIALGADWLAERPGDAPPGAITVVPATGNPYVVVPAPTFWLAPRTLVNLTLSYRVNKNWSGQLNVENLLDKDYIAASVNRANIMPGSPINVRFKVTFSF